MGTDTGAGAFEVAAEQVDAPDSRALLREYYTEIVLRYHQRPVNPAAVIEAMAAEPGTDLSPPSGLFLVLRRAGQPVGGVGLRVLPDGTGEVKRLFVRPPARRHGAARCLLAAAERAARELGLSGLRLDTRGDLVEARALYASTGWAEIPAYNGNPYADHWFFKPLRADR